MQKQDYIYNMKTDKRMRIFYIYLIKCMIVVGLLLQCIQPCYATKKRVQVTEPPKEIAVNTSQLEDGRAYSTGYKYNYKAFIIALAMMGTFVLPGAAVWFLYYKLKKKYTVDDIEKATEESQAKPSISRITTWLRLLCGKIRKKKPTYDEEKAIEKSQPTLRSKGKKKKMTKKKKNAPVNKSMEEAMPKENVVVTNVIQPEQQHMVPHEDLSKEHAVENAKEICSKPEYRRVIVLTWTEEVTDDEDDQVSTHQMKECQKEISVALKPNMASQKLKHTEKQEATDIKLKPENLFKGKLPVFPERQGIPKPSWTSQMLKNMMRIHMGKVKDVDPETLWKSVLRGTGKRTQPEPKEKTSAIPKPSLEKQILNKELKEYFQKHPERGSNSTILTGVGTSDETPAYPEGLIVLPKTVLTRDFRQAKRKPIVKREMLRKTIDEMQSRRLQKLTEESNMSEPAKPEKDQPQEDRQNRIDRSTSLTFQEAFDTLNKQARKK
ncbi:uncharacterized protein LOC105947332 [Xenopus tropicalis]|uniref:Uncharacterized protein LOC105947332 n=1 Tax=Xenopus tropicalis TaxID=8364 RepID=A0A8J1JM45_XENTR|nr:uncharacterized protein LOC105947332 [Xenopus tropicalis]